MTDPKVPSDKTALREVQAELSRAEERAEVRKQLETLKVDLTTLIYTHRAEWRGLLMRGVWVLAAAALVVVGATGTLGWNVGGAWDVLVLRVELLEKVTGHH